MNRIKYLEDTIKEANLFYRKGEPIMSDQQYDLLVEELKEIDPDNEILKEIGTDEAQLDPERKEKLPFKMASMNKVKTFDDVLDWVRLKGISEDTQFILTPKYDGLSLLSKEDKKKGWTRGNGIYGQNSDNHIKMISDPYLNVSYLTFGEVIMKKSIFVEKYKDEYANPRNLVCGLLNKKDPSENLKDCNYIRYGIESDEFKTKEEELNFLNSIQKEKVPFKKVVLSELSDEYFLELFEKWSEDFEIDGIIIEINSNELKKFLGRETSTNNPCWARAYKGKFEEEKESEVLEIKWDISKQGYLKPVIHIKPIELNGATVSKVTGNNARYIKTMGIGVGSTVSVIRSGMVIPFITKVLVEKPFEMPEGEDIPNDLSWNESGVELKSNLLTDRQILKQNISFFKILDVKNFSEGIIKQLFEKGYKTPKSILEMSKEDFQKLPRFGERKAEKVFNSIKDSTKNVELSKLQHASGLFENLGSKKLKKLENLKERKFEKIIEIDGFSEISAKSYLKGIEKFDEFYNEIKDLVNIVKIEKKVESDKLKDKNFVFSGIRRKDLNEKIELLGGSVKTSVSSKTSYLIVKEKGSGTSKEVKAKGLGKEILTIEELENLLDETN